MRRIWSIGWNVLTRRPWFAGDRSESPDGTYYDGHYRWASHLAGRYASLYRCSFLTNYVLGACAVTLVMLSLLFHSHETPLIIAELVCILTILGIYIAGRINRWHDRAADYRILAELLRQMKYLESQALFVPNSRPPAHYRSKGDLASTWISGHFQAIVRGADAAHCKFVNDHTERCQDHIADDWIMGQVKYHLRNRQRMHSAGRTCAKGELAFFLLTLCACISHLALTHIHGVSPEVVHAWGPWLIAAAASFPAWAAALHGIENQGEFHRLADRSESMSEVLGELHDDFPQGQNRVMRIGTLRAITRTTASLMAEEAIDWRVLYPHGIPTA